MRQFFFVFGRTPALSFAELKSFIPEIFLLKPNIALSESKEISPTELMATLGGTVKIALVMAKVSEATPLALGKILAESSKKTKRITFGISSYEPSLKISLEFLSQIKRQLEAVGFSSRFVAGHDSQPLGSVVVAKQDVTELIIAPRADKFIIGKTLVVQPFTEWNERDYGRPYVDPRAGMLPPKVARMAVNLALGPESTGKILLDPFCGMGTILAEAAFRGAEIIGSDQRREVVAKAQKNLIWLAGRYPQVVLAKPKFMVSDATHISEHLAASSVDAVVTEPFLGSPDVKKEDVKNIIKALKSCISAACAIGKKF